MRVMKFRAWDSVSKSMMGWNILKDNDWLGSLLSGDMEEYVPLQYTGFKDEYGNEVYEGDILCCGSTDTLLEIEYSNELNVVGFVGRYIEAGSYCNCMNSILRNMECKIIGNIFENPELLEGENNDR